MKFIDILSENHIYMISFTIAIVLTIISMFLVFLSIDFTALSDKINKKPRLSKHKSLCKMFYEIIGGISLIGFIYDRFNYLKPLTSDKIDEHNTIFWIFLPFAQIFMPFSMLFVIMMIGPKLAYGLAAQKFKSKENVLTIIIIVFVMLYGIMFFIA